MTAIDPDDAQFSGNMETSIALAVWDGGKGEINGKKSVSTWVTMGIEAPTAPLTQPPVQPSAPTEPSAPATQPEAAGQPGHPITRVACNDCGEGINDGREFVQDDKIQCRACADGAYYSVIEHTVSLQA